MIIFNIIKSNNLSIPRGLLSNSHKFLHNRKFFFTTYSPLLRNLKLNANAAESDPKKKQDNLPSNNAASIPHEIYQKQKIISRRIPGETTQANSISSRLPNSLKFESEAMPTLLPRPGVPPPNTLPLRSLMLQLEGKTEPELIYEAEPHKLWFVACYAFGLVFIMYTVNAFTIGYGISMEMYNDNEYQLSELQRNLQLIMHLLIVSVLSCGPLLAAIAFLGTPTRLIRRIWYLPPASKSMDGSGIKMRADGQAFIRFTTHPLLPNRPTPVFVKPLGDLQKSITSRIYSGSGFYGTNDSSFFFFLRPKNSRIPFIVDRKGFFWGDGRVMDILFSTDSIDKVEQGKKVEEVFAEMLEEKKKKELELKKELGFGWRSKSQLKLMQQDVQTLKAKLSGKGLIEHKNDQDSNKKGKIGQ
ncbi:hypothetical protein DAMA08_000820 [Martiniozyma asiatica (nom. inval.)]|nr:hypothetical protein DAMA08_000820 [Martiniozyma asiatica]